MDELLQKLNAARVRFLLIGGQAMRLIGIGERVNHGLHGVHGLKKVCG